MKEKRFMKTIAIMLFIICIFTSVSVNAETRSNNPMLKEIYINGEKIKPEFEMFTTEYVVLLDENVEKVDIKAVPDDKNASVKIIGNSKLNMGRNEIEIKVTAEDGKAKQSYFLYITRGNKENANANLKELTIKNAEIAPTFEKNTINYAVAYPESLDKIEINAVPEVEGAIVEIIGNENLNRTNRKYSNKSNSYR